jgi:hypothetical protein
MKVIGSSDFDLFLLSLSMFFFEVIYVNHNVIARRMKNSPRLAESSLRRGNLKIKKQMALEHSFPLSLLERHCGKHLM